MLSPTIIIRMVHRKCRSDIYPSTKMIERFKIPDDLVPWNVNVVDYHPVEYESSILNGKEWADPPLDASSSSFKPKWNEMDGRINRKSHTTTTTGPYCVVDGRPLNPEGRTGLRGRGILGRWGPNHAADPIVTRWKMIGGEDRRHFHPSTDLAILQCCCIQRKDCDEWALPGGMVDPGEQFSETLKREFVEEALDHHQNAENIERFFGNGVEIYRGYVDDPRNTDNAWMETVAVNFHDEDGSTVGKFNLKAGDDAKNVKWVDVDRRLALYASHSSFVEAVAKLRNGHW